MTRNLKKSLLIPILHMLACLVSNPKPQPVHFNNSTTRRPRSEKSLQTSGSRTFLSFSCLSIANQEAVGRSAALLLRIKALALQKRPLFFLFVLVRRTTAVLDMAMLCTYQCKSHWGGGGNASKGRGFDAWDYPGCRAFDRAKQPRGRDI